MSTSFLLRSSLPRALRTIRTSPTATARVPAFTKLRSFQTSAAKMSAKFFQDEPENPVVTTDIPGPKSQAAISELNEVFDTRALTMICDYQKSSGNYLVDMDGNKYLDVYSQIASIAVGYSNPALMKAAMTPEMVCGLVNRPALGPFPPGDWASLLKSGILSVAPKGLDQVFTGMTGSDANETAYKAACIFYRRKERGEGADFTEEELRTSMENQKPGSPELAILSFKKAFHGRLFASLSTTRSKPIHKVDIPAFNWPQARFPALKYPLEENVEANKKEEADCLADVERLITSWHCPVAAVVVEPIQSEGGDNHASPEFFRGLRELTKKRNVLLIVDEVQTGVGATGKFWAHDHWNLQDPPDIVTFSKKAQAAGFYFGNPDIRPNKAYRQFNTWMGDPCRAIIFRAIIDEIKQKDLVNNTKVVGDYLYGKLDELQKKYPKAMENLRGKGQGTFIAWDAPDGAKRDKFIKDMKKAGVNIGGSGDRAIRLRPMLVFQRQHADILVSALDKVLQTV